MATMNFRATAETVASDAIQFSSDAEVSKYGSPNAKVKEITVDRAIQGARICVDLKCDAFTAMFAYVFKNGVPTSIFWQHNTTDWVTKTADINISAISGDKIQLYMYPTTSDWGYARNFRIEFDIFSNAVAAQVSVDPASVPVVADAWHSPDGFVDSSGDWSDEAKAYDGDTATYAYVPQNLNMWCDWVRFTFSAPVLTPTQFRIWMSHEIGATPKTCHVRAYDGEGGDETLINTGITEDAYVTVNVTTLTKISYFEVRFEGQSGVTFNIYVNEVAVYGK